MKPEDAELQDAELQLLVAIMEALTDIEQRITALEHHTHTTSPGGYTGGPVRRER